MRFNWKWSSWNLGTSLFIPRKICENKVRNNYNDMKTDSLHHEASQESSEGSKHLIIIIISFQVLYNFCAFILVFVPDQWKLWNFDLLNYHFATKSRRFNLMFFFMYQRCTLSLARIFFLYCGWTLWKPEKPTLWGSFFSYSYEAQSYW